MRNPQGCLTIGEKEHDTFTCGHCNAIVVVMPKCAPEDLGAMCKVCSSLVCSRCANGTCVPFERKLEQIESRDRFFRQAGI